MDGTIIFNTPNYKVWVGNYKSRIEAERNLIDIKNISKRTFDSTKIYIYYKKENRANCLGFFDFSTYSTLDRL
jgi:hypothetical protein